MEIKFKDYGIISKPEKIPDVYLENEVHVGWIPKHNVIYVYFKTKNDTIEYQIWRQHTVRYYVEKTKQDFLTTKDQEKQDIYNSFFEDTFELEE